MRTLMMGMLFCLVSGDSNVINVTSYVGGDVLLPCTCLDRDSDKEFRWQAKFNEDVLVVKHNGITSNFTGDYKDRAELFPSEDKSSCSLLLKKITPKDEGKYTCSFKYKGRHKYSYVNLTVSETDAGITDEIFAPSPDNILWQVIPAALVVLALVAVLSLFLFFLYKRKASGRLNAGKGERELTTLV